MMAVIAPPESPPFYEQEGSAYRKTFSYSLTYEMHLQS